MEFDKSKILTVVTAGQAKVGQKGWFAVLPEYIKESMSSGQEPSVLSNIDLDSPTPFTREGRYEWPLFYPAPEPTYSERQAQWVKENNVKEGTKVRVTRTFTEDEDGSRCREHDDLVGMTGVVYNIYSHNIGVDMSDGSFRPIPYFALEVIKEPTYRPFKNAEEFKPYREKWLRYKHNIDAPSYEAFRPFRYSDDDIELLKLLTWEQAFNDVIFEDGTPFGIKEEA